jgi:hypothetical protein
MSNEADIRHRSVAPIPQAGWNNEQHRLSERATLTYVRSLTNARPNRSDSAIKVPISSGVLA